MPARRLVNVLLSLSLLVHSLSLDLTTRSLPGRAGRHGGSLRAARRAAGLVPEQRTPEDRAARQRDRDHAISAGPI